MAEKWNFELVAGPFGATAEGPAWSGQHFFFSVIQKGLIKRYDPKTGECITWREMPTWTNGLMFDARGTMFGCDVRGRSIIRFEADGKTTTIADRLEGKRLNTPNDLAISRSGRIYFSNPWMLKLRAPDQEKELDHDDAVLLADPRPDGSYAVKRVTTDVDWPNGVLLSADEKTLYVSQQSYSEDKIRELRAYTVNDDGSLGSHTVLHQFGKDHRGVHRAVDGMCFDEEGNIVACAGWQQSGPGPLIYVFAPNGRVLETHPYPAEGHPTNCTFGDADLRSLYVCGSKGHVFRIRTDRRGWNLYP